MNEIKIAVSKICNPTQVQKVGECFYKEVHENQAQLASYDRPVAVGRLEEGRSWSIKDHILRQMVPIDAECAVTSIASTRDGKSAAFAVAPPSCRFHGRVSLSVYDLFNESHPRRIASYKQEGRCICGEIAVAAFLPDGSIIAYSGDCCRPR